MTSRKPLGCGLLILSALVGIATIVGFFFLIFGMLNDITSGGQRFVVPGSGVVHIEKAGKYSIFHETQSVIDGVIYHSNYLPSGMSITVTDAVGTPIPTMNSSGGTYSSGGYQGVAVLDVSFPEPGDYTVTATILSGEEAPLTVLSVSEGLMPKIMMTVFGGWSLMFLGLTVSSLSGIAGLVLLLLGLRKNRTFTPPNAPGNAG